MNKEELNKIVEYIQNQNQYSDWHKTKRLIASRPLHPDTPFTAAFLYERRQLQINFKSGDTGKWIQFTLDRKTTIDFITKIEILTLFK